MKIGDRPKKILVVDDEADLCQYLKMLLTRRTAYQVDTINDPIKAIDLVKNGQYNLLISDIHMPKMDGIEVLRQAKNADPNIEVIMLTGASSFETAVDALQHRAYDYIEKPVQAEKILYTVGNALAKQELSAELGVMIRKVSGLNRELKQRVREQLSKDVPAERLAAAGVVTDTLEAELAGIVDPLLKAIGVLNEAVMQASPPVRQAASEAGRLARRMEGVFRRIQTALTPFRPQPKRQDLSAFVKAHVDDLAVVFPKLEVAMTLPETPVEALFDSDTLGQVLAIVVQNASDAMGGTGKLSVALTSSEREVELSFADSGPGLAADARENLFQPLFTTKGRQNSGMGLAIARKHLQEQSGRIALVDGPAGGVIAKITLSRR